MSRETKLRRRISWSNKMVSGTDLPGRRMTQSMQGRCTDGGDVMTTPYRVLILRDPERGVLKG